MGGVRGGPRLRRRSPRRGAPGRGEAGPRSSAEERDRGAARARARREAAIARRAREGCGADVPEKLAAERGAGRSATLTSFAGLDAAALDAARRALSEEGRAGAPRVRILTTRWRRGRRTSRASRAWGRLDRAEAKARTDAERSAEEAAVAEERGRGAGRGRAPVCSAEAAGGAGPRPTRAGLAEARSGVGRMVRALAGAGSPVTKVYAALGRGDRGARGAGRWTRRD